MENRVAQHVFLPETGKGSQMGIVGAEEVSGRIAGRQTQAASIVLRNGMAFIAIGASLVVWPC